MHRGWKRMDIGLGWLDEMERSLKRYWFRKYNGVRAAIREYKEWQS